MGTLHGQHLGLDGDQLAFKETKTIMILKKGNFIRAARF